MPGSSEEIADSGFGEGVILGLQRIGKTTIAMVNGPAVGGGFDIALACDMRIGCFVYLAVRQIAQPTHSEQISQAQRCNEEVTERDDAWLCAD